MPLSLSWHPPVPDSEEVVMPNLECKGLGQLHERQLADIGEHFVGYAAIDFNQRNGIFAGRAAAQRELRNVNLRVAQQCSKLADKARLVFVHDIKHVRRKLGV